MGQALAIVLGILKAIPALKDLFDEFVALYTAHALANMRQAHRDGIRKAVKEHDQRDLENSIGSPIAGEPSGRPGSVIRDKPPGVR